MSFRQISRAVIKIYSPATRNPAFKKFHGVNQGPYMNYLNRDLYYRQSRGIFWNEKTQEAQKEQAAETEAEPQQEQAKTAKTETTKKTDAKVEEQFDVLLEDPTPENKKKIHALWLKLEKEAKDRATEVQKLKSQNAILETATNDSKQKIDDLRSRLKEEIEERELMRKRFDKELDQSKVYAISKFAKDIIEVPDNLGRALEACKNLEGKGDNLYEGVKSTNNILLKVLERHGVVQLNPLGEKFDPNYHEALFDFVDPNQTPGSVGMVANTGYMINDRVLRPAKVGVVKAPEKLKE